MIKRDHVVPFLKQERKISLYPTNGKVWSILNFAKANSKFLAKNESELVHNNSALLSSEVPANLFKPLTSVQELKNGSGQKIRVNSIGSRSAYWTQKQFKFKGCRPFLDLYFPHEKLDFGSKRMTTEKIRFGVLSAENVMREILAYIFFKSNNLDILHTPVAVFEYKSGRKTMGFCLVSKTPTENRLENEEDFYDLTIKDLVKIRLYESKLNKVYLTNYEAKFKNISQKNYSAQKSSLLIDMNFRGGFRGFLNSNLGNDIYYQDRLYICDFDTFKIIEIPKNPNYQFIKNFCLWSIVELLKSSPFVLDYCDIEGLKPQKASKILWDSFIKNSSLYKSFVIKFYKQANNKKWNISFIDKAFKEVRSYHLFFEIMLDNILNSKILQNTYKPELSFYIPHNY